MQYSPPANLGIEFVTEFILFTGLIFFLTVWRRRTLECTSQRTVVGTNSKFLILLYRIMSGLFQ